MLIAVFLLCGYALILTAMLCLVPLIVLSMTPFTPTLFGITFSYPKETRKVLKKGWITFWFVYIGIFLLLFFTRDIGAYTIGDLVYMMTNNPIIADSVPYIQLHAAIFLIDLVISLIIIYPTYKNAEAKADKIFKNNFFPILKHNLDLLPIIKDVHLSLHKNVDINIFKDNIMGLQYSNYGYSVLDTRAMELLAKYLDYYYNGRFSLKTVTRKSYYGGNGQTFSGYVNGELHTFSSGDTKVRRYNEIIGYILESKQKAINYAKLPPNT